MNNTIKDLFAKLVSLFTWVKSKKRNLPTSGRVSDGNNFIPQHSHMPAFLHRGKHRLRNKTAHGIERRKKRNIAYRSKLRNCYGLN